MKKYILLTIFISSILRASPYLPQNGEAYEVDSDGYITSFGGDPVFDNNNSTVGTAAIHYQSPQIKAWATSVVSVNFGKYFDVSGYDYGDYDWKVPERAIGPATGDHYYGVVPLGSGGDITLYFSSGISNGDGFDFVIFENADFAGFAELAYVEVSSDGEHFVRFPNMFLGTSKITAFGNTSYPQLSYNLGSKYHKDYGHGYDLAELEYAYNYIMSEDSEFSDEYKDAFLADYQYLDLENVNYVRIVDIPGRGSGDEARYDSFGNVIYDPYRTTGTPGFDLQGVGVINTIVIPESESIASVLALVALFLAYHTKRKKVK